VTRLVRASLIAAVLVLAGTACGQHGPAAPATPAPSASPRPASPARLTIITPANGQVLRTPAVRVKTRLKATGPASPQAMPGWIHLYVDGKIKSIQPVPGSYGVMVQAIGPVKPGPHQLRAEFVKPDHLPFRPPVTATVTFTVRKP
jgi:hypothetical protein